MVRTYDEAKQALREYRAYEARIKYFLRRQGALDAYGGQCRDCGSTDRPNLFVVREFGTQWGVALTGRPIKSGAAKYKWLKQNNYPEGFILLCRTCRGNHVFGTPSPSATAT